MKCFQLLLFNHNNSIKQSFVYTWLKDQTLLFQTILFSVSTYLKCQTGSTYPRQSGPASNGNERILCISQSSSITEVSPSDCLVSYPGHSSHPFAEIQSVYSTAPVDWASFYCGKYQTWPIKWNVISSRLRSCRCCCRDALLGPWLNGWRRS